MNAQKHSPQASTTNYVIDGSISGGFKTYYQSSVVMKDYGQYANALHTDLPHKKEKEFLVYWIWDITGDQKNNGWRYVWFEVGTWRRAEWFYKNKIIFMPLSNYPFVGLND